MIVLIPDHCLSIHFVNMLCSTTGHGCPEDESWCDQYCQQHGRTRGICDSSICRCAAK